MRQYNKAMNSVRVSVEWLFGEITKYFLSNNLKYFEINPCTTLENYFWRADA
jgi:hypothetical protein